MNTIKAILRTPSAFVVLLAAIVTLIGVIITNEYNKTIATIPINATVTAEVKLTELAHMSTLTQIASMSTLTSIVLPPTSDTPTLTLTPTVSPSLTPQPTDTPLQTPTKIPTFTPTIEPKVFRGLDKNCIDKKYWYPKPIYSSDKITLDINNCWNLSSWGILAENQTLKFSIQDGVFNEPVTRSIYTIISDKVTTIQFKVKVDNLTSASNMDGALFIGLGNEGNYTKPGLFVLFVVPAGQNRAFLETGPGYMKYWEPRIDYTLGEVLTIKIVIMDSYVSVRVNGTEIRGVNLDTPNKEVLWIGYTTPATNNYITADIFDFTIYEK